MIRLGSGRLLPLAALAFGAALFALGCGSTYRDQYFGSPDGGDFEPDATALPDAATAGDTVIGTSPDAGAETTSDASSDASSDTASDVFTDG
jgi:hypothetical protein